MRGLTNDLHIPKNLNEDGNGTRIGVEFDPNEYFTVLDHLEMEVGYTLDYEYVYRTRPILYARRIDQPPHSNFLDFGEATGVYYLVSEYNLAVPNYLDHVLVDDTREGYLQFVLLLIHGEQFYLYGHGHNNDTVVICNQSGVENIFTQQSWIITLPPWVDGQEMPEQEILEDIHDQARVLDVTPHVTLRISTATVQVVAFTHWGGFYEATFTISRDFPHQVLDYKEKELVPYDFGIKF
jgi:hypothetical protein